MQAHRDRKHVEQRHHAEDALVGVPCRQRRLALTDVDRHLAVADIDALWQARGATGILQCRQIVGSGRGRRPQLIVGPPVVEPPSGIAPIWTAPRIDSASINGSIFAAMSARRK